MHDTASQNADGIESAKLKLQSLLKDVDPDSIFVEMRRAKESAEECRRRDSEFAAEKFETEARLLGRLATISTAGGAPDFQPEDASFAPLAGLHIEHPGVKAAAEGLIAVAAAAKGSARE